MSSLRNQLTQLASSYSLVTGFPDDVKGYKDLERYFEHFSIVNEALDEVIETLEAASKEGNIWDIKKEFNKFRCHQSAAYNSMKKAIDQEAEFINCFIKYMIQYPVVIDNETGAVIVKLDPVSVPPSKELNELSLKYGDKYAGKSASIVIPENRVRAEVFADVMEKYINIFIRSDNKYGAVFSMPLDHSSDKSPAKLFVRGLIAPLCVSLTGTRLRTDGTKAETGATPNRISQQSLEDDYRRFEENDGSVQITTLLFEDQQESFRRFNDLLVTTDLFGHEVEYIKENIKQTVLELFRQYGRNVVHPVYLYSMLGEVGSKIDQINSLVGAIRVGRT